MKLPDFLYFPQKDTRYPFLFLMIIAFLALGAATYFYFTGHETVIPWETVTELQPVSMPAGRFSLLLQTFDMRVKGFLVTERFEAGLPVINYGAAYLTLLFLAICSTFYLAVVSTFRQLPFFGGMTLFMLFLTTFNFDLLGIFGSQNQYILIGSLVILGLAAYLLQSFFTHISLRARLGIFFILITVIGIFLFTSAPLTPAQTALHLVNYSSVGGIIAAVIFMVWIGYENIHGLLWFNTQAENPARRFSLWQFVLICALYLANLGLLYVKNADILKLDMVLLNAFLVFLISTVVGFWGTKRREMQYENFFSFENGAAFLYLVFATLTIASMGYAFATANDSTIRAYTDLIVYTHLAYGIMFMIYILVNYGRLINQKLRVYRVVYNPKNIPYYTVLVMGSILLVALIMRPQKLIYHKFTAGYYNYLGDFFTATNDDLLAERFYDEGSTYDHNNIKSTYSLAALYNRKAFLQMEIKQLEEAVKVYSNAKIYARLANKYTSRENLFKQLFLLRAGLRNFPQNGALLNNQALAYSSTALTDSAEYFFDQAQKYTGEQEVIQNNRLAYYLNAGLGKKATEMAGKIQEPTYLPLQSNLLLIQNFSGISYSNQPPINFPAGSFLDDKTFAAVYQAALAGKGGAAPQVLKNLEKYIADDRNSPHRFDLLVAKAYVQNQAGQTLASRTTLENLSATEPEYSAYLQDLIGQQLLEQKLYAAATAHFEMAYNKGWPEANFHRLAALAFQPNRVTDALLSAADLSNSDNPEIARFAQHLQYLITASPVQIITQKSDSIRVQYLQLNRLNPGITSQEFVAISSTVRHAELKKEAQKELAAFYVSRGNVAGATTILQGLLPNLTEKNKLLSEVNILQAEILLRTNNLAQLSKALPKMYLSGTDIPLKYHYQAVLADNLNLTKEAKKQYDLAVKYMPYHEKTVLAAADFYTFKLKKPNQAYDILLNSITYNRNNPEIFKTYILKSIEVGYSGFAESALEELSSIVSPAEMAAFRPLYERKLAERQAALGMVPVENVE